MLKITILSVFLAFIASSSAYCDPSCRDACKEKGCSVRQCSAGWCSCNCGKLAELVLQAPSQKQVAPVEDAILQAAANVTASPGHVGAK